MSYLPYLTGNSCGKSIIVYTFDMCLPPHHEVQHRTTVLSLTLECLPLFLTYFFESMSIKNISSLKAGVQFPIFVSITAKDPKLKKL